MMDQPVMKSINFRSQKGDIVPISTVHTDYLCKIVENFHFSNWSDEVERNDVLKYMTHETRWRSARAVYLEVQNRYVGKDGKYYYSYNGGTGFAIGPHHLLTAHHLLQPDEDFVEMLDEGQACYSKIMEMDPYFELQENEKPEETVGWNEEGEYEILQSLPDLDVIVLITKKTHLVTPLYLQPIYSGLNRIFTLDLRNYFSQQIHSGKCWTADASLGDYYFFDFLTERGFSGGPILGISFIIFFLTLLDRYGAALGIVLSDAGKQRAISRFVSLAAVFDALTIKDSSWADGLQYVKSKYDHGVTTEWTTPVKYPPSSDDSPYLRTSSASPIEPTSPENLKSEIVNKMDSVLSRVRQYKRFIEEWEGQEADTEHEHSVTDRPGLPQPPRVLNWRMRVGVSKVQGRRVVYVPNKCC
jgi:hypothetical protein